MSLCLNPFERHASQEIASLALMCPEPQCGYLLEGAAFGSWQVRTLVRHTESVDLYFAVPQAGTGSTMLVKILKKCADGSLLHLEPLLSLQHTYIHTIQYTGWMNQAQAVYLLTRYEERGSLALYLEKHMAFSLSTALTIALQIAQALQQAHDRRIVHGHLKPENCLVVAPERIQVCDLYYSLLAREQSAAPSLYTAPEQQYGRLTPASDQYALAVLFCHLLSSQRTSLREDRTSTPSGQTYPRFVLDTLAAMPGPLQQVLARALAYQPDARFFCMLDFAFALQQASSQGNISGVSHARPKLPAPSRPTPPPASRPTPPPSSRPTPPPASRPTPPPASRQNSSPQHTQYVSSASQGKRSSSNTDLSLAPRKMTTLCRLPGHTEAVTVVRWAADGNHLASAGPDGSIRLWFVRQRVGTPLTTLQENTSAVTALNWSKNGRMLASAATDASLRIWRISPVPKFEAELVTSWWGHDGSIIALDWSQEGLLASGGKDRTVRLWDPEGQAVSSWPIQGHGNVTALAWSPVPQMLATGCSDGSIHIWNAQSGIQQGFYASQKDEIRHLAWDADGRFLASHAGKKDLHAFLWDTQTGQKVADLGGHTHEITGLFYPHAAPWMATLGTDRTLRCWSTTAPYGAALGPPIALEMAPLAADCAAGQKMVAIGTSDMLVHILQWSS